MILPGLSLIMGSGGRTYAVDGPIGKIAFEDEGTGGLPVVLLHSFGGDRSHWEHVRSHLKKTRRVVTIELRGHGQSGTPENGDFRIAAMAEDVAAVVDVLRLKRFVLIGHSMGASVALHYAGAYLDRVAGLVLVDGAGDPRGLPDPVREGIKQALRSDAYEKVTTDYWQQILAGSTAETRQKVLADLKRIPRGVVVAVTVELLDYDPIPSMRRYSGPALSIVAPANDGPSALHRLGEGMDHRVIHGTGHWLQLDRPDDFQRIVDHFLEKVDNP